MAVSFVGLLRYAALHVQCCITDGALCAVSAGKEGGGASSSLAPVIKGALHSVKKTSYRTLCYYCILIE